MLRTVGKVTGRALIVVGIAWDAYRINEAYQEEGEVGDKTQQATGRPLVVWPVHGPVPKLAQLSARPFVLAWVHSLAQ